MSLPNTPIRPSASARAPRLPFTRTVHPAAGQPVHRRPVKAAWLVPDHMYIYTWWDSLGTVPAELLAPAQALLLTSQETRRFCFKIFESSEPSQNDSFRGGRRSTRWFQNDAKKRRRTRRNGAGFSAAFKAKLQQNHPFGSSRCRSDDPCHAGTRHAAGFETASARRPGLWRAWPRSSCRRSSPHLPRSCPTSAARSGRSGPTYSF